MRYAERTPEEASEKQKGEFHESRYKIGSVANVAYLAWSQTAMGVANIEEMREALARRRRRA